MKFRTTLLSLATSGSVCIFGIPAHAAFSPLLVTRCQATPVQVAAVAPLQANPPGSPCHSDYQALFNQTVGAVTFGTATARTSYGTTQPEAETSLADVHLQLPGLDVQAKAAHALVTTRCVAPGVAQANPTSEVVDLVVNHQAVVVGQPVHLVTPVGTLHLNTTVTSFGTKIQRAIWLQSGRLGDIVIGEAQAGLGDAQCLT